MTVGDNVALPLRELTELPEPLINEMVRMKLGLVGLAGMERPRSDQPVGWRNASAPRSPGRRSSIRELVFCDEPSAGLDPVVAASIDETLLQFRTALGITLVIVTHELESIRTIADRGVMFARRRDLRERHDRTSSPRARDRDVYNFFHRVATKPDSGRQRERRRAAHEVIHDDQGYEDSNRIVHVSALPACSRSC